MRNFNLRRLLKSKRALGTPVANLIILVAAVLLATVVVVYAIDLTTSQVQKEKLYITTTHIWYVNSAESIAAIGISNIGPTDIVLTQINVNGLQCQWNGTTNYIVYCAIDGPIQGDLPFVEQISSTANTTITIGGQPYHFTVASEGLTIKSGWSIAFYIVIPNLLSIYDLSTPVQMTISTAQGVYFTETIVQST
jgi:hypothetical protein